VSYSSYVARARHILREVPEGEDDNVTNLAAICDALANASDALARDVQTLESRLAALEQRVRRVESA
jgi:hypothetical protein